LRITPVPLYKAKLLLPDLYSEQFEFIYYKFNPAHVNLFDITQEYDYVYLGMDFICKYLIPPKWPEKTTPYGRVTKGRIEPDFVVFHKS